MDRRASDLVIDASAAIGILTEERSADELVSMVRGRRLSGARVLVPSLFWLEVINTLSCKYRALPDQVVEAISELDAFGLDTVELDRPLVLLTVDAVGRHGLTAYDATYLVLAQTADADLLTLDARLAAAAGDRAIRVESGHSIGESSPPYETPAGRPMWADWPGAANYLRELRARMRTTGTT